MQVSLSLAVTDPNGLGQCAQADANMKSGADSSTADVDNAVYSGTEPVTINPGDVVSMYFAVTRPNGGQ